MGRGWVPLNQRPARGWPPTPNPSLPGRGAGSALLLSLLLLATPAAAQEAVTSPAPEKTSISLYRDPDRGGDDAINARFPSGFALVTETRTIRLPAGRAVVRFEGVSAGIIPESAIVRGLPANVREKNLDADLLSPRALYDRALGRRVMIRRTNRATGAVTNEQAVIRSSGAGAAVLQTAAGIETVGCTGLAETITYGAVPPGLPARPTLSIETDAPAPVEATVTLSYLAGGFDWQANHVVTMRPDGTARWFSWATLVSTDSTSYPQADAQLIAGRLNREEASEIGDLVPEGALSLQCWTTEAPPEPVMYEMAALPPPPAPAPMAMRAMAAEDIVVTGARVARLEALGDLKLYRVPQPVTVAANAQKQVALIDQRSVRLDPVFVTQGFDGEAGTPRLMLRARNRDAAGLGLPLPAGRVAVFEEALLVGEASLDDRAIGDKVEVDLGERGDVSVESVVTAARRDRRDVTVTVRNATPRPIAHELRLRASPERPIERPTRKLVREDGLHLWRTVVPANGTATLRYRLVNPRAPDRVPR